jgi:hypothetical protein
MPGYRTDGELIRRRQPRRLTNNKRGPTLWQGA